MHSVYQLYKIEIIGEGVYQLDYYLYDVNGEIKLGSFFGSSTNELSDQLEINFNKENLNDVIAPELNFESVLTYLDDVYNDEHINNHGLYTSIRKLIENSQKNKDKGSGKASKILLEVALQKVRFGTPQLISGNVSEYLQKQIEILLNTLN